MEQLTIGGCTPTLWSALSSCGAGDISLLVMGRKVPWVGEGPRGAEAGGSEMQARAGAPTRKRAQLERDQATGGLHF